MKTLLWNVKFGDCPGCSSFVNRLASNESFDVICLTESTTEFLEGWENILRSRGDYGYDDQGVRQKVSLWSRYGWDGVDWVGSESLPPGRFLSGITNGIRVVGICIPWQQAHVSSGRRNRKGWEDHRAFLAGLQSILAGYAAQRAPVCVLGDFNQTVPPSGRSAKVYRELEAALGNAFTIGTANVPDADGKLLIDHVATTSEIRFELGRTISRNGIEGKSISDHPGLIGSLVVANG